MERVIFFDKITYDYLHFSEKNLWSLMYLTGYLTQVRDYKIDDGWQDNMVALKTPNLEIKLIFEAKRARSVDELESECEKALRQIDERMYARDFEDEYDSDHIHCYGIAFYKKRCLVKKK